MKKISERMKDVLILAVMMVISAPISWYFTYLSSLDKGESVLPGFVIYIWIFALAFACLFSYLESRDKDPFVTGKTQRMGVVNSFTVAAFLMAANIHWFAGWLCSALVVCACIFLSRELGRYSYRKRERKYLNKSGILQGNLPDKAKLVIDGKRVTVWSKDTIKSGTPVYISEIKGTYLYVSPVKENKEEEI